MPVDTRTTGPQNAFKTVPSRLNDSRHCAIHQSISDSAPFFLTARTKAFTVMGIHTTPATTLQRPAEFAWPR